MSEPREDVHDRTKVVHTPSWEEVHHSHEWELGSGNQAARAPSCHSESRSLRDVDPKERCDVQAVQSTSQFPDRMGGRDEHW